MSNPEKELELETVELEMNFVLGEALERLKKNKDYQTVIQKYMIEQRRDELVSLLAHEGTTNQGNRPRVMEDLVAISHLQYELGKIAHFHQIAIQDSTDEELMEEDSE